MKEAGNAITAGGVNAERSITQRRSVIHGEQADRVNIIPDKDEGSTSIVSDAVHFDDGIDDGVLSEGMEGGDDSGDMFAKPETGAKRIALFDGEGVGADGRIIEESAAVDQADIDSACVACCNAGDAAREVARYSKIAAEMIAGPERKCAQGDLMTEANFSDGADSAVPSAGDKGTEVIPN
jgi:hypothetical protein